MIEFIDSIEETPFKDREGVPEISFGRQYGINTRPLDFQYESTEAITSFSAIEIDRTGKTVNTTVLNTSLIASSGGYHICTGLVPYGLYLPCGTYYFLVNNRYESDVFRILAQTCIVIVDNITNIIGAAPGGTATIEFDANLTGFESVLDVEFTYSFSLAIPKVSNTETLTQLPSSISQLFTIPLGVSGDCVLYISNNLCSKVYAQNFTIASDSLELETGGCLELELGGCLNLED